MAISKCGACGKMGAWGLQEVSPTGSNFKMNFVQCNWCGAVVGVVPFHDPAHTVAALGKALGVQINL
jgi:hypothetical protein